MASLSSKRKVFTNRQLQRRDTSAKKAGKQVPIVNPAATFDDALYAIASARYDAAAGDVAAGDIRQLMRAVIQQEFNAGGRDGALKMRPYILKFVGERRARGLPLALQA